MARRSRIYFTDKQKADIWVVKIIFNNMHEVGTCRVHEFYRTVAGSGGDSHCTAQTSGLPSAVTLKSLLRGTLPVKQHYYFAIPSGSRPRGLSTLSNETLIYGFQKRNPTLPAA